MEAPSQRKRGLGEERRGVNVNALRGRATLVRATVAVARGSICGVVDFASDVSMLPVLIGGAFLVGAFIGAWWYRRRRTINISDSYGPMLG